MKRIVTTNTYCKECFGEKLYKLSLSAATSCPNREAGGGCIFCSAGGSGDFAAPPDMDIEHQIAFAREKVGKKYKGERFIAYFQSFTGTYGDLAHLRKIYLQTARRDDIAAISIATRPDCLGEAVMDLLAEICAKKPLWIELGLQTENDETAKRIGRGYDFAEYERALKKLRTLPIHIITHIILGLPGENREQMLRSVAAAQGDGIKLQLLHILEGTPLAEAYRRGECKTLKAEEYFELVADALAVLPEGMVVHRMTGDGDKRTLIAPLWSADKKKTLVGLRRVLAARGLTWE